MHNTFYYTDNRAAVKSVSIYREQDKDHGLKPVQVRFCHQRYEGKLQFFGDFLDFRIQIKDYSPAEQQCQDQVPDIDLGSNPDLSTHKRHKCGRVPLHHP